MLTTAGDVNHPVTVPEFIFVIAEFLVGVLLFATIIGNVGEIITSMNSERATFEENMDGVKRYMTLRKVNKDLDKRVIRLESQTQPIFHNCNSLYRNTMYSVGLIIIYIVPLKTCHCKRCCLHDCPRVLCTESPRSSRCKENVTSMCGNDERVRRRPIGPKTLLLTETRDRHPVWCEADKILHF